MPWHITPKRSRGPVAVRVGLSTALVSCATSRTEPAAAPPSAEQDASHVEAHADDGDPVAAAPPKTPALVPTPIPKWEYADEGSGYRCRAKTADPGKTLAMLPTKGRSITVNPRSCQPARGSVALPLGSFSVEVEGLSKDGCNVVVTDEVEGGYTRRRCSLSTGKKHVVLEPGSEPKSCTVIETGNVHHDMEAALAEAIPTAPIEGTSFTFGMRQDSEGDGPSFEGAALATFDYQLYETKAFAEPASCERCAGRLTLDVSPDGSLGAGVRSALRSPSRADPSPIAVGGTRSIIVREETAQGLRPHLPSMPHEAQICIRLTLVDVE